MKKISLFALAAAGMLLGACSDKDVTQEIAQGPEFGDGAFIGVSIQMPSAMNSTRANEDFNDGVESEYDVKDATLFIFSGASEATAKYVAQYQIGTTYEMDGGNNVTSTMREATEISNELAEAITKSAETTHYYGYVILNNNGVNAICDENTTFADFQVRQWSIIGTPVAEGADPEAEDAFPNGLLMTNSPVSASAGGSEAAPTTLTTTTADGTTVNYNTLVELDKTKIFATRAAAVADPAACIYVERAAVKITVAVKTGLNKVGTADNAPAISFTNWQIVNYPETYYNTRQIEPAWGDLASDALATDFSLWNDDNAYRFVSGTAFGPKIPSNHAVGPFRTYFAKDPTYNADATLLRPKADVDAHWIGMTIPGYTVENTFDVPRQKWGNTTQVCFKATIGDGSDFYTLNGGDTFIEDPETTVTNLVKGLPAVKNALQVACDELADADLAAWTASNPPEGSTSPNYGYTASVTVSFKNAITAQTPSKDGVEMKAEYTITGKNDDSTKDKDDLEEATAQAIENALKAALANYVVSFHKGGVAYYNARIQHFGEYETPWSISKPYQTIIPGTNVLEIYGYDEDKADDDADNVQANKRFLGRYGVVRDNWYQLSVDAVMHVGTAEPIDVSSEKYKNIPDDQIENYIAVHVHIIPWVIRNQSVSF